MAQLEGHQIEGTKAQHLPEARKSAKEAGYMALIGAKADADCAKVNVPGGISRERACCNLFEPETNQTIVFSCGTCEHQRQK